MDAAETPAFLAAVMAAAMAITTVRVVVFSPT